MLPRTLSATSTGLLAVSAAVNRKPPVPGPSLPFERGMDMLFNPQPHAIDYGNAFGRTRHCLWGALRRWVAVHLTEEFVQMRGGRPDTFEGTTTTLWRCRRSDDARPPRRTYLGPALGAKRLGA